VENSVLILLSSTHAVLKEAGAPVCVFGLVLGIGKGFVAVRPPLNFPAPPVKFLLKPNLSSPRV
jgi:hypothetical protein